jgi:thiol-disulfide isomerase/thioredoxin
VADRPEFTHRRERRGLIGPFGGRQLLAAAAAIVIAAVVLVVVTTPLGSANPVGPGAPAATQFVLDPAGTIGVRPGQLAPELAVKRADGTTAGLTDLSGRPVRLADLRGKAVWLNFWASWCPPCQSETPVLRDVAERYASRGLVVIGISVQEASADNVAAYAARYQLGYTIAADVTGEIYRLYHPPGLPTSIFIGPEGAVRSFVLAPLGESAAIAQVEAILPGVAASGSASASASPSTP